MGADIHDHIEVLGDDGRWRRIEEVDPFEGARNYALFGWLADVRNYSAVTPLAEPRGLPGDVSPGVRDKRDEYGPDGHSDSWFTLAELLAVDYDAEVNDRRVSRKMPSGVIDGGVTGEPDEGRRMTLRSFLGDWVVGRIEDFRAFGEPERVRLVFWFDN